MRLLLPLIRLLSKIVHHFLGFMKTCVKIHILSFSKNYFFLFLQCLLGKKNNLVEERCALVGSRKKRISLNTICAQISRSLILLLKKLLLPCKTPTLLLSEIILLENFQFSLQTIFVWEHKWNFIKENNYCCWKGCTACKWLVVKYSQ